MASKIRKMSSTKKQRLLSLNKKRKRGRDKTKGRGDFDFSLPTESEEEIKNESEGEELLSGNEGEEILSGNEGEEFSRQLKGLQDTDPEFYQFLQENDEQLLEFEPNDSLSEEEEEEREDDEQLSDEEEDMEEEGEGMEVIKVSSELLSQWKRDLKNDYSTAALNELTSALHCAIVSILAPPTDNDKTRDRSQRVISKHYIVQGGDIFNSMVLACLQYVCPVLEHHLPPPPTPPTAAATKKHTLPSSHKKWSRLKVLVKCYLLDILQLLNGITDSTMICALLRHIEGLWVYYSCFPKLSRILTKALVKTWAQGKSDDGTTVISFLLLRKVYLGLNEKKREAILKQLYLSYIRNSRYTSPSSLPHIRFMCNCLVELLSLFPDHAYQLIFIYTRQLANQLRSALTNKTTPIATWPFVHSLELFTSVLSSCQVPTLAPLIYPVTQVGLGVVYHLSSSLFIPTRLHVVRMLLGVAMETNTYIPLAPILLEILEHQSSSRSAGERGGGGGGGKPPNLLCTLKFRKTQINTKGTQSGVLNTGMDLLLQFLVGNSHHISFPEMVYPTIIRMRKVVKTTPISWFRHHMKQIIDKTEATSKLIMSARADVTFSPKDSELIDAWERERKDVSNPLKSFMETWLTIQKQIQEKEKTAEEVEEEGEESEEENNKLKSKRKNSNTIQKREKEKSFKKTKRVEEEEEEEGDQVEDFELTSDDNDDL